MKHTPENNPPTPDARPPELPDMRRSGTPASTSQMLQTWAVATVLWVLYGIVYAEQLVSFPDPAWGVVSWSTAFLYSALTMVICWVPLTILLAEVARHVPVNRRTLLPAIAKLALALALVTVLRGIYLWLVYPAMQGLLPTGDAEVTFAEMLVGSPRFSLLRAIVVLGACYAWVHLQTTQEARLRIAELESGLTRARLDALAAQLNPHFLFNALNSIAELIHLDPQAADRMLIALSALLRRSLSSPGHEVTVQEEAALVSQYFSIEKIRLGERLDVHWAIAPDCAQALVPALVLQPLAENAIVHGIARRRTPGRIDIAIRREDARLVMEVSDDGRASEAAPRRGGSGIGLSNTQARLRCLYGNDWSLTLHTGTDARSVVRVELPLRFREAVNDPLHDPPLPTPAGRQAP